jgi:hypothetical protein
MILPTEPDIIPVDAGDDGTNMLVFGVSILAAVLVHGSGASSFKVEVSADSGRTFLEVRIAERDFPNLIFPLPSVSIPSRVPSVVSPTTTSAPSSSIVPTPIVLTPITAALVRVPSVAVTLHSAIEPIRAEKISSYRRNCRVSPGSKSVHCDVVCDLDICRGLRVTIVGVVGQDAVEERVENGQRILPCSSEELIFCCNLEKK